MTMFLFAIDRKDGIIIFTVSPRAQRMQLRVSEHLVLILTSKMRAFWENAEMWLRIENLIAP